MKNKPEVKNVIIFVCIVLVFSTLYMIINNLVNKETEEIFLKDYNVNEYIPIYVSDDDMAKIYLNDYIHIMYTNIDKAYSLLDQDYRNKKFGSVDNYRDYVKSLNNLSYVVDSFYIDDSRENKIYGVYDTNGNLFIFETNGVMQYTVYLDDYTVEI